MVATDYRILGFALVDQGPLDVLDLVVDEPGIWAIYGRNGAGKSSVLRAIRDSLGPAVVMNGPSDTMVWSGTCVQIFDECGSLGRMIRDVLTRLLDRLTRVAYEDDSIAELEDLMSQATSLSLKDLTARVALYSLNIDPSDPAALVFQQAASAGYYWLSPGTQEGLDGWRLWLGLPREMAIVERAWDHALDVEAAGPLRDYRADYRAEASSRIVDALKSRSREEIKQMCLEALSDPDVLRTILLVYGFGKPGAEETIESLSEEDRERLAEGEHALLAILLAMRSKVCTEEEAAQVDAILTPVREWMEYRRNRDPRLPIPVCDFGVITEQYGDDSSVLPSEAETVPVDLARSTYNRLPRPLIEAVDGDEVVFAEQARGVLETVQDSANDLLVQLLVDAPKLECKLSHPETWPTTGSALRWTAHDPPSGQQVSLERLSAAQQHWASLAISSVLPSINSGSVGPKSKQIVLLDEPEAALHSLAAAHMVHGLKTLSRRLGAPVVVATHSPVFLNDLGVKLIHARRGENGRTDLVQVPSPLQEAPELLGLSRADMLQLYRLFVVVEGVHDRIVLEGLLGDTLTEYRCRVIPMNGADSLRSVVDTQLIFDFTEAGVLAVVDHAEKTWLVEAWETAKSQLAEGGNTAKRDALETMKDRGRMTKEEQLLLSFCRRAIEAGRSERVDFVGLPDPDILFLLPVGEFVPGAKSWSTLNDEWLNLPSPRPKWKEWLRNEHRANTSRKHLEQVVGRMDQIPQALDPVRNRCIKAGHDALDVVGGEPS
ncbi:MAG: AAA family ATPase [Acidimicrobiales bacterium]